MARPKPLERLSEILLGLPEIERHLEGRHAGFAVRGRRVAWFQDDHHGDGIVGVVCKAHTGENEALIARDPELFYMPSYLGPKGWIGVRLDVDDVDWDEVEELCVESYRLVAPKTLARRLG